jgi:hypothetical protein
MPLLARHTQDEAAQWVIIESLCIGLGLLHGRDRRGIAEIVETVAARICTGEREYDDR